MDEPDAEAMPVSGRRPGLPEKHPGLAAEKKERPKKE